jgi:hypothetical protein
VSSPAVAKGKGAERRTVRRAGAMAAMGLEAEFAVIVDGAQARPEDVFGSPTRIVRAPMMHRTGRSYHLPNGGAVYFDTGVIELATPVIEIERGCAARAGRSLWESIRFLRQELDAWEEREGHTIHLSGFSTHYNVSFDLPRRDRGVHRSTDKLAMLLTHILPVPVMLLAANCRSTGIGVRPRPNRIEVTADFTPDAALMIAAATLIVGIVREVMTWPSFELSVLASCGFPIVRDFAPEPHSSRTGWVAKHTSFSENPFCSDVNAAIWPTRSASGETLSLREIARRITRNFWPSIARHGDRRSLRLIDAVMSGQTLSLLELDDRPESYDRVGRLCTWADLFPVRALPRSRYERVFIRAISGRKLRLGRDWYTPVGMRGWSHVVFTRDRDETRHVFSLDSLLDHLDAWDVGPRTERTLRKSLRRRLQRRRA